MGVSEWRGLGVVRTGRTGVVGIEWRVGENEVHSGAGLSGTGPVRIGMRMTEGWGKAEQGLALRRNLERDAVPSPG